MSYWQKMRSGELKTNNDLLSIFTFWTFVDSANDRDFRPSEKVVEAVNIKISDVECFRTQKHGFVRDGWDWDGWHLIQSHARKINMSDIPFSVTHNATCKPVFWNLLNTRTSVIDENVGKKRWSNFIIKTFQLQCRISIIVDLPSRCKTS